MVSVKSNAVKYFVSFIRLYTPETDSAHLSCAGWTPKFQQEFVAVAKTGKKCPVKGHCLSALSLCRNMAAQHGRVCERPAPSVDGKGSFKGYETQ